MVSQTTSFCFKLPLYSIVITETLSSGKMFSSRNPHGSSFLKLLKRDLRLLVTILSAEAVCIKAVILSLYSHPLFSLLMWVNKPSQSMAVDCIDIEHGFCSSLSMLSAASERRSESFLLKMGSPSGDAVDTMDAEMTESHPLTRLVIAAKTSLLFLYSLSTVELPRW